MATASSASTAAGAFDGGSSHLSPSAEVSSRADWWVRTSYSPINAIQ